MRKTLVTLASLAFCGSALAQTVTLQFSSPQDGQTVTAGATINWQIDAGVSTIDNAGLAAVTTDIAQDGGNPELFNIPPAAGVPVPMTNFSRPAGISNPGESNPTTGYTGVQRGADGAFNLVQIGGAQNGFGQALPGGSGIAESAAVVAGVGQSGNVVIATGSFTAPATAGTYTFSLANASANVFSAVNTAPDVSPAVAAVVDTNAGTITFTVGGGSCGNDCVIPGGCADTNGDGAVDLTDLANVLANFGGPGTLADGDTNGDGTVDLTDLANILALFGAVCP